MYNMLYIIYNMLEETLRKIKIYFLPEKMVTKYRNFFLEGIEIFFF